MPNRLRELKSLRDDIMSILAEVDESDEPSPVPADQIKARLHSIERTGVNRRLQILKYYLHEGRQIFGLETGLVAKIDDDSYTVIAAVTDLPIVEGMQFNTCDTYCADVYSTGETHTILDVEKVDGGLTHPVYKSTKLRSYIGSPLKCGNKVIGSVSFCSTRPRSSFFGYEHHAVEFLTRLIADSVCDVTGGCQSCSCR